MPPKISRFNILNDYCKKNNITLCDDYSDIKINRSTPLIKFKCKNCQTPIDKSYDTLVNNNSPLCKICHKNNNQNAKYNSDKLLELVTKLNIKLKNVTNDKNQHSSSTNTIADIIKQCSDITRSTRIIGHCQTLECPNMFNTSYRELEAESNKGQCKTCTTKVKAMKVSNARLATREHLTHDKSFASHAASKHVIDKTIDLRKIPLGTHQDIDIKCPDCNHPYTASVNKIVSGRGCPYCCYPQKRLCGDPNCNRCFNKSCASNAFMVKHWNYERNITISKIYDTDKELQQRIKDNPKSIINYIFKSGDTQIWLNCKVCKKPFRSRAKSVEGGCGCPKCKNKTEKKMQKQLVKSGINVIREYTPEQFEDDKNLKRKRFDFLVEGSNIIIELDGEQHFKYIELYKTPLEQVQYNDNLKMKSANDLGYSIIRIYQPDVHFNKYDWTNNILRCIEQINSDNIVQNLFICSDNKYNCFQQTGYKHTFINPLI